MKIITINQDDPDPLVISEIAELLRTGAVIAYPTDTVYGLGVDITNISSIEKIFSIKKRMLNTPILILISNRNMLSNLIAGGHISPSAECLINAFWPGPLTLVFYASESVQSLLTASTGKIGIRFPDSMFCRILIDKLEHPLTATSANISGDKSLDNPVDVIMSIGDKIDAVIDGGTTKGGVESSVVDVTGERPVVLREGAIPLLEINKVIAGACS